MRIVVCVKHVPHLESARAFSPEGRTVRSKDDGTLNEVDENAVEAALSLREGAPPEQLHEVIALTLGPASAVDAVRGALQMGADRAVHISDEQLAGADYAVTAAALAAAVRTVNADAIVFGMAALDGLGAVVPSLVAAELDLPQLTVAHQVSFEDGAITIERDAAGTTQTWRAPLPVVLSVTDVANSPRLPKMKEILAARAKEVEMLSAADLNLPADLAPRTQVISTTQRPPRPGPELVTDDDGRGGRKLADYLIREGLI